MRTTLDQRWLRRSTCLTGVALMTAVCSALLTSAALATNYTWSGGGSSSSWSEGANWLGAAAPSSGEAIGTLSFPSLHRSTCLENMPSEACYTSANDVSGLSVNAMQIDDSHDYGIVGDGLTLGSGGLTINSSEGTGGSFNNTNVSIRTPLTLSSSQTWTVSGPATTSEYPAQNIAIQSVLSGTSSDLTVNLNSLTNLVFGIDVPASPAVDDEIGNITVNGSEATIGNSPALYRSRVVVAPNAKLNATDGHSLTLHHVDLEGGEAIGAVSAENSSIESWGTIGALTANESHLELSGTTGPINATNSTLTLSGSSIGAVSAVSSSLSPGGVLGLSSLSLGAGSTLDIALHPEQTLGNSELTSTGNITLSGANLALHTAEPEECPVPHVGQVYTLLSTTGSLTGVFANAPNGSTITADCTPGITAGTEPITYAAPFRISYQLEGSPQTITATALAAEPAMTHNEESKPSITSGGSSSGGSSSSTGSTTTPITTISSTQLGAALRQQLIPSSKVARIPTLLKDHGLVLSFKALEAGTLLIQWYELPSGANLAGHKTKPKPVLVASGQTAFAAAGSQKLMLKLTAAGKALLKHVRSLRLTAKGVFTPKGASAVTEQVGFVVRR